MKSKFLLMLVCLSVLILFIIIIIPFLTTKSISDNNQTRQVIANAKRLTGNNSYFFKGLHGAITPGFYVLRGEKDNLVYNSDNMIFRGGKSNVIEAFLIDASENKISKLDINDVLKINHDVVIIFSPNIIYVLNFNSDDYGYYERN